MKLLALSTYTDIILNWHLFLLKRIAKSCENLCYDHTNKTISHPNKGKVQKTDG